MATTLVIEDGPTQVINARRTESIDAPAILELIETATTQLFGRVNVVNLIEKASLAVTLNNDKDVTLGHAAFFDYPNVNDVEQAEWETWANQFYDFSEVNPLNSLFLHFFVAKTEYAQGCAKEIIRTAFNAIPDLHYIFLVVPMGVFPEPSLESLFTQMEKKSGVTGPDNCAVFKCERPQHFPVLHVRPARVEDHDDLTPIFNRQSDMLNMTYGDFFLAELIEAQDDRMHCLVAEVDGTAIGFMSISDDVNFNLLNECFELSPFHGLRKPHPEDETTAPKSPTPTPPPQANYAEDRPISKESVKSVSSKGGETKASEQLDTSTDETKTSEEKVEEKLKGSRASSARSSRGSASDDDMKVKPKLSDAQSGGSSNSLLSQKSTADAVLETLEQQEKDTSLASVTNKPLARLPTPKPATPVIKPPKRFVPVYNGEPNAICIQLFCIDERYEMRSCDFLTKAFSLFPSFDFCALTVPHLVPEFPLLQSFTRVTPRCPSILSQELYVFSRFGLAEDFLVRTACTKDFSNIQKLVETINLNENLLKDLEQFNAARRDEDGTEIQAFVAEVSKQIVGVGIVRREEDIEYIRAHYNIEDFVYYNHHRRDEHGHLHHFALNPIFKHRTKHFLKEMLRLGHKTCLYYPLYPCYTPKEIVEKHSLVDCLNEMVPVKHRRQIIYPLDKLDVNAPSERILKEREPYALNHFNRKLVHEPKVTVNARICVVGASDVGISFLESLAYCPHLRFNNLTLISPHGLPGEMSSDELRDQMLANSHNSSQDAYAKASLRTWVNVVYGRMTTIDRKKKFVVVNGTTQVPYDHLVICTGQQYQIPNPDDKDQRYNGVIPRNLFIVNDAYEAAVALYWIETRIVKTDKKVIVYGNKLDAYCAVQSLLSLGVPGNQLQFVKPPQNYDADCFHQNKEIHAAVDKALKDSGVEVYTGYELTSWNEGSDVTELFCAGFTANKKSLNLDCDAFLSFYKKGTDINAFKAINDACLVYDGRLVIDAAFHTNDVAIRAAGSLTKFQRKYHAEDWCHSLFNSKEVGMSHAMTVDVIDTLGCMTTRDVTVREAIKLKLATEMLKLFDPTLEPQVEPEKEPMNLIPIYRCPKIEGGILPGGYNYLCVYKPGENPDKDGQDDKGTELVTKTGDDSFFRLFVNEYNTVQTIRCFSKEIFPANNFICLYSIHERYLNNLLARFEEGLVKDLFSYFMESWCMAIYHDRFLDFRDEIRELLITNAGEDGVSIEEKTRQVVDEDIPLNENQRKLMLEFYKDAGAKRSVETRLLNFISYNYYHLPMYAKPGMV